MEKTGIAKMVGYKKQASQKTIDAYNRIIILAKVNGLKDKEIAHVIGREFGFKWSVSTVNNIKTGFVHSEKITVTQEDIDRLNVNLDGIDAYQSKDLSRLDKLGIVDQLESYSNEEVINHFNSTIQANINKESIQGILKEVNELLEGDSLKTEDELWFKVIILKKRKLKNN